MIEQRELFNCSVKEAKYFSEDIFRSKVIMGLIDMGGTWISYSLIAKTLMNTVKDSEYEELSKIDVKLLWALFFNLSQDEITQKFFIYALKEIMKNPKLNWVDFYQEHVPDQDEVTVRAVETVFPLFDKLDADLKNNKLGTVKRLSNELSSKYKHFESFDIYEMWVYCAYGAIEKLKIGDGLTDKELELAMYVKTIELINSENK